MNTNINVIKCGTHVITTIGSIRALITAVCMRANNISYELSYFQNGTHTTCWLHDYEFKVNEAESKEPGFNNNNKLLK